MKLSVQALPGTHRLSGWVCAQHSRRHCWEGRVVQGFWRAREVRAALGWQMNMTNLGDGQAPWTGLAGKGATVHEHPAPDAG